MKRVKAREAASSNYNDYKVKNLTLNSDVSLFCCYYGILFYATITTKMPVMAQTLAEFPVKSATLKLVWATQDLSQ